MDAHAMPLLLLLASMVTAGAVPNQLALVSDLQFSWTKQVHKAHRVGDGCDHNEDCDQVGQTFCDLEKHVCSCLPAFPIDGGSLCGKVAAYNETCSFSAQCLGEGSQRNVECRDQRCQCLPGFKATHYTGASFVCNNNSMQALSDPTMIGVLVGLILMFVIMCVVLRLFSKARWRENRTIFNTPNPRLANASLLKEVTANNTNKAIPGSRRGSLRIGSRQSSLASFPIANGGTSSNAEDHHQHHHHHLHPPQQHHQATNTVKGNHHHHNDEVVSSTSAM